MITNQQKKKTQSSEPYVGRAHLCRIVQE